MLLPKRSWLDALPVWSVSPCCVTFRLAVSTTMRIINGIRIIVSERGAMKEEKFWAVRAKKYERLEWVNKPTYLGAFLAAGCFRKTDRVLDVGTGTGIIAHSLSPHVKEVIGIDISEEMLKKAHQ